MLGTLRAQERHPVGDRVDAVQVEAVPTVAPRRDPAQRGIAVAAEHDRDATVAHRLRIDPHRVEVDELAVERGDVVAPQRADRVDVLLGARTSTLERDAERVELLARPADADAEREPASD